MEIRDAVDSDVDAIVALVESAYRGDASRAGWTTEADYLEGRRTGPDEVLPLIGNPKHLLVVAIDEAGALGCYRLDHLGDAAYFGMFAVRPTSQGGGLGSQLLTQAGARAVAEWGVAAMEMTVVSRRTELLAYYARRGYVQTGETRPFPYGDERFGRPQVTDLEFVVLRKPLAP